MLAAALAETRATVDPGTCLRDAGMGPQPVHLAFDAAPGAFAIHADPDPAQERHLDEMDADEPTAPTSPDDRCRSDPGIRSASAAAADQAAAKMESGEARGPTHGDLKISGSTTEPLFLTHASLRGMQP
jgi:hypothetical protein